MANNHLPKRGRTSPIDRHNDPGFAPETLKGAKFLLGISAPTAHWCDQTQKRHRKQLLVGAAFHWWRADSGEQPTIIGVILFMWSIPVNTKLKDGWIMCWGLTSQGRVAGYAWPGCWNHQDSGIVSHAHIDLHAMCHHGGKNDHSCRPNSAP